MLPRENFRCLLLCLNGKRFAILFLENYLQIFWRFDALSIRGQLLAIAFAGIVPLFIAGIFLTPAEGRRGVYVFVALAAVVCAVGAALFFERNFARRLQDLASAARRLGEPDFSARVAVEGTDEIARVGESFNQMAERLEKRTARYDELDRLKSEFVSSVSHELRTPLTTIKALTRLLMRGELTEEKRREYLETISVECDRQIDLVLNLLDLSRIEGGVFRLDFEKVGVAEVVSSCVKSESAAAEKRRHTLRIAPFGEIPPVCADPKALRRVLSNLIENAIKYTPDGGLITVSAREEKGFAAISVEDNGRGIPPEDLPVLFDKFHRGRPAKQAGAQLDENTTDDDLLSDAEVSGVGLGLYLARNVMEQMGGRIEVETEVGRGSIFTLYLPLWDAAQCGKSSPQTMKKEMKNGETTAGR